MTSRRQVLKVVAVGAASLSAGAWTWIGRPAAAAGLDLHTVVFDDRFIQARRFADEIRAIGLPTTAIKGDVTALWYDDLYHRWKKQPVGLAGLTTPETLFALKTLGGDFGLRLALEVEHRMIDGQISHEFRGPPGLFEQAALEQPGPGWTGCMARLVAACPPAQLHRGSVHALTAARADGGAGRATLVSWVLAPIAKSFISTTALESA